MFFIYINSYYSLENEKLLPKQWSIFGKEPERFNQNLLRMETNLVHKCESSLCQKDCMKEISKAEKSSGMFHPKGITFIKAICKGSSVTSASVNKVEQMRLRHLLLNLKEFSALEKWCHSCCSLSHKQKGKSGMSLKYIPSRHWFWKACGFIKNEMHTSFFNKENLPFIFFFTFGCIA